MVLLLDDYLITFW